MPVNFKNRSVDASRFAMVPRADVPRSTFQASTAVKTTFDAGDLVPIYLDEVLPGDSHRVHLTAFARLPTLLVPLLDNLHLDTFFFFVPNRLLWDNWERLMGHQDAPTDTTSYLVPQVSSDVNGWPVGSLGDYMGLPTVGQVGAGNVITTSALPFRAYNLIFNEWFRDENLVTPATVSKTDGPDGFAAYILRARAKRPDYFTTCLPWPQKPTSLDATQGFGWQSPGAPYAGSGSALVRQIGAPVTGLGAVTLGEHGGVGVDVYETGSLTPTNYGSYKTFTEANPDDAVYARLDNDNLLDVRVTINAIRQAFAVQKLQERDARGGTRYAEIIRSHFGVISPDHRLQRPEYLGGGSAPINIQPVSQTSGSGGSGQTTPQGHLTAQGTSIARHGFSQSFTEHGWIIGLVNVRGDLSYYQGIHKMWSRRSKYDYYWPAFAMLGEQAVLVKELYATGDVGDETAFGYQERWAEYRTKPALITSKFRGNAAGTLDYWHLAQRFTSVGLNSSFINDPTAGTLRRALAAGVLADGQQILLDGFFSVSRVRPLPAFSVPGFVDHF